MKNLKLTGSKQGQLRYLDWLIQIEELKIATLIQNQGMEYDAATRDEYDVLIEEAYATKNLYIKKLEELK